MAYDGEATICPAGDPTGFRNVEPQWERAKAFRALIAKELGAKASLGQPRPGLSAFEFNLRLTGTNDRSHHAAILRMFPGSEYTAIDRGEKWFVRYADRPSDKYGMAAVLFACAIVAGIAAHLLVGYRPYILLEE